MKTTLLILAAVALALALGGCTTTQPTAPLPNGLHTAPDGRVFDVENGVYKVISIP